ncbi:MAG: PEP-CTERM sorting domain-containing protein [Phycisphaeraceae bacterium]
MKCLTLATTACLALGAFSANATAAAVIFQDDYENVAPGETPSPTVGSYIRNDATVVEAGGANPASPTGGSNISYLWRPAGDGITTQIGDEDPILNGTYRIEMDLLFADVQGNDYLQFGLLSDDGTFGGNWMVHGAIFSLRADGTISWYNHNPDVHGGTGHKSIVGVSHTAGEWSHVAIEYELGNDDISLTVGSDTLIMTLPFTGGVPLNELSGTFITAGGGAGTGGYFDNVNITSTAIPEPASAALLGLGGMMMLKRRRH